MKYLFILFTLFSFNTFAESVNINKANAKTIAESLKGVGIKKAEAIVRYRSKHGAFKSLDDLRQVNGIGEQTIKSIASDVGLSKGRTKSKKVSKSKKTNTKAKKQNKKKTTKKTKEKKSKKVSKKDKKKTKSSKPKKKKKSKTKKSKTKKSK